MQHIMKHQIKQTNNIPQTQDEYLVLKRFFNKTQQKLKTTRFLTQLPFSPPSRLQLDRFLPSLLTSPSQQ